MFGTADDFDAVFAANSGLEDSDKIRKLHGILRPFLLRRLKVRVVDEADGGRGSCRPSAALRAGEARRLTHGCG